MLRKHINDFVTYQLICAKLIPRDDKDFQTVIKRLKQCVEKVDMQTKDQ